MTQNNFEYSQTEKNLGKVEYLFLSGDLYNVGENLLQSHAYPV